MKIKKIISFLVPPGKHDEERTTSAGTDIPLRGRLYEMLKEIFDRSDSECKIPICFRPDEDGHQINECRDEVVALISRASLKNAKKLAIRLMKCTTNKSGLGLLFFILGKEENTHKLVISRFPAEQGIMAEENKNTLSVTFIERVFMKNANSYKAVAYGGTSFDAHFWEGSAIDRQIANSIRELSNYWIKDFLISDFKTTPAEGTRRLAKALRGSLKKVGDITIKNELVSAAVLASNLSNQAISVHEFCSRLNLSEPAKTLIMQEIGRDELADARFLFDKDEFAKHALYKSVELDNGGTLIAATDKFDDCFKSRVINAEQHKYHFETEGVMTNTKLKAKL